MYYSECGSVLVCGRYKITSAVMLSDSTPVFLGKNIQTEQPVHIKAEARTYKHPCSNYLYAEGKVLQKLQGGIGIPNMHWGGVDYDYNFLVLQRLGPNLQQLLDQCGGQFSYKTILMLSYETLRIIEYVHTRNFVHRNINPRCFVVGVGKRNTKVMITDLMRARCTIDKKTNKHFAKVERGFCETNIRFSSVRVNEGMEASRRDDLQSLLYTLAYLSKKKSLPWSDLPRVEYTDINKQIHKCKSQLGVKQFCAGMPKYFEKMFSHVRELGFAEKPDYAYMKQLVCEEMQKQGILNDGVYDWLLITPSDQTIESINHGVLKGLQLETMPFEDQFLREQYEQYIKESTEINFSEMLEDQAEQTFTENIEQQIQKPSKKDCAIF